MNKTNKSKKRTTKSLTAKATALGISRSTLYSWKESGAPVDKSEAEILGWAMAENRKGPDTEQMRHAKLGVLRETERRLKIANDDKSKEILKRADVERETGQAMTMLWQCMDLAFGYELPPLLMGCDVHDITRHLGAQLQKFKDVLRLELKRFGGEKVTEADFQAAKLSAEAQTALRVCEKRAWAENIHHEWTCFMDWKRQTDKSRAEVRYAWCRKQAAAGLPVPDATAEELAQHHGLKRTE